jgi:ATP-dependent Clp protease ATP-binding subunit ClpA
VDEAAAQVKMESSLQPEALDVLERRCKQLADEKRQLGSKAGKDRCMGARWALRSWQLRCWELRCGGLRCGGHAMAYAAEPVAGRAKAGAGEAAAGQRWQGGRRTVA